MGVRPLTGVIMIWLLIVMVAGQPQIVDFYDTLAECQAAIVGEMECVPGTVVRPGVNEWYFGGGK